MVNTDIHGVDRMTITYEMINNDPHQQFAIIRVKHYNIEGGLINTTTLFPTKPILMDLYDGTERPLPL